MYHLLTQEKLLNLFIITSIKGEKKNDYSTKILLNLPRESEDLDKILSYQNAFYLAYKCILCC